MEKKKSIIASSLIASAIVACSSFTTNAAEVFLHRNLGSGGEIRTNLSREANGSRNLELNCGAKTDGSDKTKTEKDGKCGKDHKHGKDHKCGKKGKDGKCGEGKCGDKKKEVDKK